MDNIKLYPGKIKGTITVPSSKSFAHRALIAAALCGKKITINNVIFSDDILATVDALKNIGVDIAVINHGIIVDGSKILHNSDVYINANESGSTLRFMIPVVLILGNDAVFDGKGRLPQRPLDDYFSIFDKSDIGYKTPEGLYLPLETKGVLDADVFEVSGNVSSQFITGLMLCGMVKPVKVKITTTLQSRPYVDITIDVLRKFGCTVTEKDNIFEIIPGETEIAEYYVENDWSQAAFFLCAGAINGDIAVGDMNINSVQGDRQIIDILKEAGADINVAENYVSVKKSLLNGFSVDVGNIPDLVPVLSVLACYCDGTTKIYNASRLRLKESDRLKAMESELVKLGADVEIGDDYLLIRGGKSLTGTEVESHNDHRVVMSMAVASLGCKGKVEISGYKAVNKSYPTFFDDWSNLYE